MKAIYYWGDYFLIPEEYDSVDAFLHSEAIKAELTLKKLNEKGCIAPYFIEEEITKDKILLDEPKEICPVDVTVLPKEEYHNRLLIAAKEYCKGCKRYKEEAEFLAKELSLDGMCYEDEDEIRDQFKDKVDDFWTAFALREDDWKEKANSEDLSANDELASLLSFLPGVYVSLRKIKDKYYLMISSLFDQYLSALCQYLAERAPDNLKNEWEFYSYLPQNVYKYIPTNDAANVYQKAPKIKFTKKNADRPRFDVVLKIAPCDDPSVDVVRENLLYVFSILGENRFYAALSSLNCDTEYDKDDEGFVHVKDYSVEIQKEYMQNLRMYFRRFHYGEFPLKKEQAAGRRKDDQLVTTNCDLLTQALLFNRGEALKSMNQFAGYIGTLTFHFGCSIKEYSPLLRAIHDQIEDALFTPGYIIPFATCYGSKRVYVDFILADINQARKAIRSLTPLLQTYHTSYTETTAYGSNTYRCDFELGTHEA